MSKEFADLSSAHLRRMSLAMEIDVSFNPVDVSLLRAVVIVACADEILNL